MKANEIPEKIYLQEPTKVRIERLYNNDIEYVQTDAFIEKACEWLIKGGYFVNNTETIEDFKKAMEK